jgi:hypothetical protein
MPARERELRFDLSCENREPSKLDGWLAGRFAVKRQGGVIYFAPEGVLDQPSRRR